MLLNYLELFGMECTIFQQETLQGYAGAALIIKPNGKIGETNAKGEAFSLLVEQNKFKALQDSAQDAITSQTMSVRQIPLDYGQGEILLEATFIPFIKRNETNNAYSCLVLLRDLTMENNLRSALIESRQRYKDLIDISSDFAWEVDTKGVFQFVSPKGALGFKADEIIGKNIIDMVIDLEHYDPVPFISEQAVGNVDLWLTAQNNTTACVLVSCMPLYDSHDKWIGVRGVCRDVTIERENEAAVLRARHREYLLNHIVFAMRDVINPLDTINVAAEATIEAMMALGARIYRIDDKGSFFEFTSVGETRSLGGLQTLLDGLGNELTTRDAVLNGNRILYAPLLYRNTVNGAFAIWRHSDDAPWADDDRLLLGDIANQLGIANEQISNHERIVTLSRTDSMTGLLNRRAFIDEELPRRILRLEREDSSAALFYIDMDNFKQVNDVHGHQMGDEAILMLRQLMIANSRPGDVMARLGGDEFALWLDNIPEEIALKRAKAFLNESRKLRQFSGHEDSPLGISVGVAIFYPSNNESLDSLIARADEAMYEVKRNGKGGIRVAPLPRPKSRKKGKK